MATGAVAYFNSQTLKADSALVVRSGGTLTALEEVLFPRHRREGRRPHPRTYGQRLFHFVRYVRPRCLKSWRFLGAPRIAILVEPPASLAQRCAEHSDERRLFRPKTVEQSSHLGDQLRAIEKSQTLCGLWQRLMRRRTRPATDRVRSRLQQT